MPLVREVTVEGFKSIRKLSLGLGRVNVLIGANGSGKSNLLEAIAYGVAAAHGKLDNEYLVPRGVRVTEARFMQSAFDIAPVASTVSFKGDHAQPTGEPLDQDRATEERELEKIVDLVWAKLDTSQSSRSEFRETLRRIFSERLRAPRDFLIFSPENSALRIFQAEPQVLPLGARGEGLFAHLKNLSESSPESFERIISRLRLFDWFEDLEVPKDLAIGERSLRIRDRYLAEGALFDQRSANEGFLFVLFYLTLFVSGETPTFFAIDNVDSALNPKLATETVRALVRLAFTHNKQVIFTTHSPAVLDALDLSDDEQRLLLAERAKDGSTRVRRIGPPTVMPGDEPVPVSEAFVRGYLGGLPKNF